MTGRRESALDQEAAADAVLAASRSLMAVAMRSPAPGAEDITVAQYRALWVLASRGPLRVVDLAAALDVAPSTAVRMCDRLLRKGLVRRRQAAGDRRAVLVSVTANGRQVVEQATARHRALLADILGRLPVPEQRAAARMLREFADAAAAVPGSRRPEAAGADPADVPPPQPAARTVHAYGRNQ